MEQGRYRRDIDGLRAIAVLSVLVYHLDPRLLPGGFLGVDIFFVISGFLITRMIAGEMAGGRFSLAEFYRRRILRIVPAYFLVVLVTFGMAALVLMPIEFDKFAMSARASILFVANFWFARRVDYFDRTDEQEYLLHLWSLAVEEQFYVVFPLVLLAWCRWVRRPLLPVIAGLGVISFAAGLIWGRIDPLGSYFMPYTRAWELMIGAAGAVMLPHLRLGPRVTEGIAWAGLALVGAGLWLVSDSDMIPGYLALLPCGGAVALLLSGAGRQTSVARVLSLRLIVRIGLLSYSMYLWHWPLITFARTFRHDTTEPAVATVIVVMTVLLSLMSYSFVERPFRRWRHRPRGRAFGMLAGLTVSVLALTIVVEATDGLPGRMPAAFQPLVAANEEWISSKRLRCMELSKAAPFDLDARAAPTSPCALGMKTGHVHAVLWGDSHAAALLPAVDLALQRAGLSGVAFLRAGCLPVPDEDLGLAQNDPACALFGEAVVRDIERSGARVVFMVGRWPTLLEGGHGVDLRFSPRPNSETRALIERRLRAALARLKERLHRTEASVVVVHSVPEIGFNVPSAIGVALNAGLSLPVGPTSEAVLRRQSSIRAILENVFVAGEPPLDPVSVLCRPNCSLTAGAVPLYLDSHHLTREGALTMTDAIIDRLPKD